MNLKNVLVADDEPQISEVVRRSLERTACRVKTVCSGRDALRQAEDSAFDLLIIDVAMPDMDGFEAVRLIKQKPGYSELPVIILTGSGDTKIRVAAEQLGVAAFLTKPFSPTALQRRVQHILAL